MTETKINDADNLIPDNTIVVITDNAEFDKSLDDIIEPLKGKNERDWFNTHAYFCLPLLIGNQYGFIVKSLYDFTVVWNGGGEITDVKVEIDYKSGDYMGHQMISPHFGMGTCTIQNRFHFRTPPNVNLMTINPPNYFISGVQHMTGVVETDNLRRDFTFNLKLTTKDLKVSVKKGDPIGCIIPVPRGYVDNFEIKRAAELFNPELIKNERQIGQEFGIERTTTDKVKHHENGRRYFKGEDVRGNKFIYPHQKSMKEGCPMRVKKGFD
tara:strand:- start:312 stop:1115 length:804 start_codon:yes stop_codon:yes gene_type:complete